MTLSKNFGFATVHVWVFYIRRDFVTILIGFVLFNNGIGPPLLVELRWTHTYIIYMYIKNEVKIFQG